MNKRLTMVQLHQPPVEKHHKKQEFVRQGREGVQGSANLQRNAKQQKKVQLQERHQKGRREKQGKGRVRQEGGKERRKERSAAEPQVLQDVDQA